MVTFDRAGTDDDTGVPPFVAAHVTGDPAALSSWLTAATSLHTPSDSEREAYGLLGLLGTGGRYYQVSGYADDDPWLHIAPTLYDEARERISACHTGAGVASFRLRWTITPTGGTTDVSVDPLTPAAPDPSTEARCVADVLRTLAFPCTPSGTPATVEARVCVGSSSTN
jgi:hypothetical protein